MSERADRCPPVPLRILRQVPPATLGLFVIAAAEGRLMNDQGNYQILERGRRPVGVQVGPVQRDRVLEVIGVTPRRWQQAAKLWQQLRLAHRCDRGRLFIVLKPDPSALCRDCGRPCEIDFASTRNITTHDAKRSVPSYVQNREPSTGTQQGERVLAVDLPGVPGSKAVHQSRRLERKANTLAEAKAILQEEAGDDAASV